MTLEDVIGMCRDNIVSPCLIHYTHNSSHSRRGAQVRPNRVDYRDSFVAYFLYRFAEEFCRGFAEVLQSNNADQKANIITTIMLAKCYDLQLTCDE